MLLTRVWELLVGSLLSFWQINKSFEGKGGKIAQTLAFAGLVLILYGVFKFDKQTPFPSLFALIPVLGAALVIGFAREHCITGKILASKPLVAIGLISYSAYLWHQPLYAFARIKLLEKPSLLFMLSLAMVSLLLAFVSWRYVEAPFRTNSHTRKTIYSGAFVGMITCFLIGAVLHAGLGFESRFSLPKTLMQSMARVPAHCFDKLQAHNAKNWLCTIGQAEEQSKTFLVLGDSHMYAMLPGIEAWAKKLGLLVPMLVTLGAPLYWQSML